MLSLPPRVRIFVCLEPADMRRSFDGLSAMVSVLLKADPGSGHLFVFRNRRGDRMKILYWDRDGYALWYKRLEAGVFRFPSAGDGRSRVEWTPAELALVLEGIDVQGMTRRKRYTRDASHHAA
jgi:transposase